MSLELLFVVAGVIVAISLLLFFRRRWSYEDAFIEYNGQRRKIIRYEGATKTLTLDKPWSQTPDDSSIFKVVND